MKRRILSILTALALCLSLCPTWALAAEYVASVEIDGVTTQHSTLRDAWNRATAEPNKEAAITLLENVDAGDDELYVDETSDETLGPETSFKVTLHGGGYTVSNCGFIVTNFTNSSLTIDNCSFNNAGVRASSGTTTLTNCTGNVVDVIADGGTAKLTGCNFDAPTIMVSTLGEYSGEATFTGCVFRDNAQVRISGGTASFTGGEIDGGGYDAVSVEGGTAAFDGCTISSQNDYAVSVEGGNAAFNSCTINSGGNSFYAGGGTAEITDCTVTGGEYAVYVNGGDLTINSGTFQSTGGGTDFHAVGLFILSGTARLQGGTFSGATSAIGSFGGCSLAGLLGHEGNTRYAYFNGDTPITAGLDGRTLTGTVTVKECSHAGQATDNGNGTHNVDCAACGLTATGEAHNWTENASCTVCGAEAAVKIERADGTTAYAGESDAELRSVFKDNVNANANATFTLLANVEPNTCLTIQINCILNLGGHTITGYIGSSQCVCVDKNTAVTIRGEGEIISPNGIALAVDGNATLEGGTYTSTGSEDFSHGVYVGQSATLSVTGEKVSIRNTSGGNGLVVVQAQSVRLSAGTYSGATEAISNSEKLSDMLAHTDNTRYAFFQNGIPVTKASAWVDGNISDVPLDTSIAWLSGTVTVKACNHAGEGVCTYTHNENTSTHTKTCLACGKTWDAEDCDYGEYTHNDTGHTRICKLCEYQNVEAHNIECTAEASGTVIAVSEACKTCGYGKDLGTVTIHIPKLVYGDLTGVVTAENTLTEPVSVAGNVKNPLGETIIFSDHATIGPPTMATLTGNALLSAGEHKIKINIVIIRDENALAECELTFNVDPAPLTPSISGTATKTYDGAKDVASGQLSITLTGVVGSDDVTATATGYAYDNANAGENKTITASGITLEGSSKDNYTLSSTTATTTGTITKSQPTIAFADGYNPSKDYDGQTIPNPTADNLTITDAGYANVTFVWYKDSVTEANKLTGQPKDAGSYVLTANIPETDNTAAASTSPLTVTISKATLTATSATVASKPYDGTDTAIVSGVTFTGLVNGETLALGTDYTATGEFDSVSAGTGKNVTVTVTLTSDKAKNYSLAQNTTTTTGTINRASSSITTAPTASGITYGQALSGSTLTGGEGSVAGAFSWTDGTVKPNAGTAQYEVTFTPTDTNYDTATVNVPVTVAKATPALTAPTAGGIQYGQKLSDSTLTGGAATNSNGSAAVAGTWSWVNGNTQPSADGVFPVAFVPSDTANYNTPGNVDASVTVNPAEPKITLTVPAYQVAGGEVKVTCTVENPHDAAFKEGIPEAVKLTYKVGDGTEQTLTGTSFNIPEGTAKDTAITVTASIAAVDGKYTAATKTATVTVTDKIPVEISGVTVTGRAYNGKAIDHTGTPVIKTLDGETVTDATVTYTWSSGTPPTNAGNYTLTVAVSDGKYIGSTTVNFTIEKATVTITAENKSAVVGSAQPELTYTVSGLADGETLATAPTLTCTPDMNTVGSYPITASGAAVPNTGNYNTTITYVDGALSVTARPSSGGSSGGSTMPSQPVTTGPSTGDGTTTQTTATPTATMQGGKSTASVSTSMGNEIVKQAVENKSETVVIAPQSTGSATKTEVSIPASTVGQIGSQTSASLTVSTTVADVTIPNGGLGSLASAGGTVTVTAEQSGNAVELTVTAGGKTVESIPGGVTLTVPATSTTPGTVAMLVHEDGTREVIRKSVAGETSVTIPLDGSAKLVIADNSKHFDDVPASSWAADAVAFASSHELFNGTAPGQFSPGVSMSRGMLAVVLHNLESNPEQAVTGIFGDVDNDQWYAEGVAWAAENGIVSGYGNGQFGPNDAITREQLAAMLWRYAGKPQATSTTLSFADADKVSGYAKPALLWAAEKGIVNGKGDGILDPLGTATRAEVAQMLKNFLK